MNPSTPHRDAPDAEVPSAPTRSLRRQLAQALWRAAEAEVGREALLACRLRDAGLAVPKHAGHGDWSSPLAMALAKTAGRPPRAIAESIAQRLREQTGPWGRIEVAGPGHINIAWSTQALHEALWAAAVHGAATLRSDVGANERVLLEYVSANPTGPLHVAHGRGAVYGDVLARLQDAAGFAVTREYYINDLGHQTEVLAQSVWAHLQALRGHRFVAPSEYYPGEYVQHLAEALYQREPSFGLDAQGVIASDALVRLARWATDAMMERIRDDLDRFGVPFDRFVSERALCQTQSPHALVQRLQAAGAIYEQDQKIWFASSQFGDDKDRVLVREDGRPTYFLGDVLYHEDKMRRGFATLINVWGADHGGYVTRLKAALTALGYNADALRVPLVQMVSLSRGGQAVRMGKRLGTAVWLRDVVDEAGRDATRYLFLQRRLDSQMDFDVDLASKKTLSNPVYYAQMGHARLRAIERRAAAQNAALPPVAQWQKSDLAPLTLPEELDIVRALARAPDVVAAAAQSLEPHQLAAYVQELIAAFHSYYSKYKHTERVVGSDPHKTRARLLMCRGLANVLAGLLALMGVDAPDEMHLDEPDPSEPAESG